MISYILLKAKSMFINVINAVSQKFVNLLYLHYYACMCIWHPIPDISHSGPKPYLDPNPDHKPNPIHIPGLHSDALGSTALCRARVCSATKPKRGRLCLCCWTAVVVRRLVVCTGYQLSVAAVVSMTPVCMA